MGGGGGGVHMGGGGGGFHVGGGGGGFRMKAAVAVSTQAGSPVTASAAALQAIRPPVMLS